MKKATIPKTFTKWLAKECAKVKLDSMTIDLAHYDFNLTDNENKENFCKLFSLGGEDYADLNKSEIDQAQIESNRRALKHREQEILSEILKEKDELQEVVWENRKQVMDEISNWNIHQEAISYSTIFALMGEKFPKDIPLRNNVVNVGGAGDGKCISFYTENDYVVSGDGELLQIKDKPKTVLSMTNDYKIVKANVSAYYDREATDLLEIKTRTGKKINLTPEHPLFIEYGWEQAKNLKLGDHIAVPRRYPEIFKGKTEKHKLTILGLLISEGYLPDKRNISFTSTDNQLVRDFRKAINLFDSDLVVKKYTKDITYYVSTTKPKYTKKGKKQTLSINMWLSKLGLMGKRAGDKFVPSMVMKLDNEHISHFLAYLFSGDGWITDKPEIGYSSKSEYLIRQVGHLLLRFGIVSIIRHKFVNGVKYYALTITGKEDISRYLEQIGFKDKHRTAKANEVKNLLDIKPNPNLVVYNPEKLMKRFMEIKRKSLGWNEVFNNHKITFKDGKLFEDKKTYSLQKEYMHSKKRCSETTLKSMCLKYQDFIEKKKDKLNTLNKKLTGDLDQLRDIVYEMEDLSDADVFWDKITSIKKRKGKFKVYDLTVEPFHNFIANDIVVHNSRSTVELVELFGELPYTLILKGIYTPKKFYETMKTYQDATIVIDESSEILADQKIMAMCRSAMYGSGLIEWASTKSNDNDSFYFTGNMIWNTNKLNKNNEHQRAVYDRCYTNITALTNTQIWDKIKDKKNKKKLNDEIWDMLRKRITLIRDGHISPELTEKEEEYIYDFIKDKLLVGLGTGYHKGTSTRINERIVQLFMRLKMLYGSLDATMLELGKNLANNYFVLDSNDNLLFTIINSQTDGTIKRKDLVEQLSQALQVSQRQAYNVVIKEVERGTITSTGKTIQVRK